MKMFANSIIVICLLAFVASADDFSTAQVQTATRATTSIKTAEQALERALLLTGFDRAQYSEKAKATDMAVEVVATDDRTPFFHDRIQDKRLWVVTFESVRVHVPRLASSWERNQIPKTYDVYLSPESSCLLKIESRYDGHDTTLSDEPPPQVAAADMAGNGVNYLDVVKATPAVDLYGALQTAVLSYGANAKQIVAHLAMSDYGGVQPRPVWSILGRGTPPFDGSSLGAGIVPVWQKNRIRCLVDATTGDLIVFMTNIPAVEPPVGWPVDSVGTGE